MKAVVQRVVWATVAVDGAVVGRCGRGFLVYVGACSTDTEADAVRLADKVAGMRVFNDAQGKMNLALADLPPSEDPRVLAISNFTLYGDALRSRRPSFSKAAPYETGERLCAAFVEGLRDLGVTTETGVFGAEMHIEGHFDGPVTLVVEWPS